MFILGKLCIEVTVGSKLAFISEELCIGCGICVKVCLNILFLIPHIYTYVHVAITGTLNRFLCCFTIAEMPI